MQLNKRQESTSPCDLSFRQISIMMAKQQQVGMINLLTSHCINLCCECLSCLLMSEFYFLKRTILAQAITEKNLLLILIGIRSCRAQKNRPLLYNELWKKCPDHYGFQRMHLTISLGEMRKSGSRQIPGGQANEAWRFASTILRGRLLRNKLEYVDSFVKDS